MYKYTYKDVIIDPEDPRVEIGAEYCFGDIPQNLVEAANSDYDYWGRLEKVSVSDGFNFKREGGGWKTCLIRKKEPEYMPFDLSDNDVRARLANAWIKKKEDGIHECSIVGFVVNDDIQLVLTNIGAISPASLLEDFVFTADYTPCGKLVEEE